MDLVKYLQIPDIGILHKRWNVIGKHIGGIVKSNLVEQGKTTMDLADVLALPDSNFINEYLDSYSLGIFFPEVYNYLEIDAREIFPGIPEKEQGQAIKSLNDYLTSYHGEGYYCLLTKTGKELKEHLADFFKGKINEFEKEIKMPMAEFVKKGAESCRLAPSLESFKKVVSGELTSWKVFRNFLTFYQGHLDICWDNMIPLREPTKAENWELYTRMRNAGCGLKHATPIEQIGGVDGPVLNRRSCRIPTDYEEYTMANYSAMYIKVCEDLHLLIKD